MNQIHRHGGFVAGLLLVISLGGGAMFLSAVPSLHGFGLSPLTLAIVFGLILGNLRFFSLSGGMETGFHFAQKRLLRAGIVLYGFRISFQEILGVGMTGFVIDIMVIAITFLLGTYLGVKLFKLDLDTAILNSSGSSICGAAAVIATEGVLQAGAKKTAVAVSTVVFFGTISMFLYPFLYSFSSMTPNLFGVYIGSTIHEVAQVVVAGESLGSDVASTAVIVKMTRVMLLAPFLLLLGWFVSYRYATVKNPRLENEEKSPVTIPWFAVGFIAVSGLHSFLDVPPPLLSGINWMGTLLLSAAMAALGMGTTFHKLRGVGTGPFLHGLFLFLFLIFAGFGINKIVPLVIG